jgi:hypothetical protein
MPGYGTPGSSTWSNAGVHGNHSQQSAWASYNPATQQFVLPDGSPSPPWAIGGRHPPYIGGPVRLAQPPQAPAARNSIKRAHRMLMEEEAKNSSYGHFPRQYHAVAAPVSAHKRNRGQGEDNPGAEEVLSSHIHQLMQKEKAAALFAVNSLGPEETPAKRAEMLNWLLHIKKMEGDIKKAETTERRGGAISARLPTRPCIQYDSTSQEIMHVFDFLESFDDCISANGWDSAHAMITAFKANIDEEATQMLKRTTKGATITQMMDQLQMAHCRRLPDSMRQLEGTFSKMRKGAAELYHVFWSRLQRIGGVLEKSAAEISSQFDTALSALDRQTITLTRMTEATADEKCAFLTGQLAQSRAVAAEAVEASALRQQTAVNRAQGLVVGQVAAR